VRHNALRRAVGASAVLAIAALLLGNGTIGSTSALFNGETKNAGSGFAGGWVDPPTAASANALGYDMSLAWTPGTHGPVTGQQLYGVDNGTSSNCTGAAYALIATMASAGTAAYTDSSRATLGTDGDWFCYQLVSTSATAWTAPVALPATQIGLATSAVSITNGNGSIAAGDTITLTFNQKTNLTTASLKVCVFSATKTILLGDLKNGSPCGTAAADGYSVAQLTTAATISADTKFGTSTVALSASAPWTMTITLGAGTAVTTGASPTWTLTPAAAILSNAVTHQATMCTTATSTCQPTTTTNF
jgi:hypothetical protein